MAKNKSTSFPYQCWLKIYLLSLLCFAPFLINFMWGNHDWSWVKEYTPLLSGVFEGRFSQFILPTVLFSGNILPVLSIAAGLLFYSLAAVLLLNLWNIKNNHTICFLLGIFIITAPYTLSWFYFAFLTLSCLSWTFVIVYAFYLINKSNLSKKWSFPLSALCMALALGGYPPVINMIGVIFFTLILNDVCLNNYTPKTIMKKYIPQAFIVLCGALLFWVAMHILKHYQLQYDTYNTANISLKSLTDNFLMTFATAFSQFLNTTSFIETPYKYLNLVVFLLALITLITHTPKRASSYLFLILALIGMLFSSVLTLILTPNTAYVQNEPRIEFFGIIYIYAFAFSILLTNASQLIKNISYATILSLICYNFATASYCAKVWNLGFRAENSQMERFISRLENIPEFNPNQSYTFIQSGTVNMRSRYYIKTNVFKPDSYTLTAPYVPWHLPYKAYTFYYPKVFVKNDFDIYWQFITPQSLTMTDNLKEYLTLGALPWPKQESIFISPELIILTLTPAGKNLGADWYHKHY